MKYSLKPWNTFGIDQYANNIVCVKSIEQLLNIRKKVIASEQPVLFLGEGSNVLFLDDFSGTVIINRIMGIKITEKTDVWRLHVGAGESWHQLVQFTIKNNMPGLENLALIPGRVGSSPIQNIGAYGVEFKHVCQYVDCVELSTGNLELLEAKSCRFSYRDSIFKHEYQNKFVITAIGIQLSKHWKPTLTYGDLMCLDPKTVTPREIFSFVCNLRMAKIPDPKVNGNAGSFFKNPIISCEFAKEILIQWPNIPHHHQDDGYIKLSAAWLIDQCHLKGVSCGGASVCHQQSLVLINKNGATGKDVGRLARLVRQRVGEKFNVWLKPEVRFIGSTGEINALEVIT